MPSKSKDQQEYVVVWGASGGVGMEVAKKCAESGKKVLAYARNPQELQRVESVHGNITSRQFEIEEDFYSKEAAHIDTEGYKIVGMVDCVGSVKTHPEASPAKRLDDIMKPNLYHQYYSALAFRKILQPGSSVVFISSIRALTGVDNANIEYGFAKAGVENLTKSMAHMLSNQNVRVNCVRPTPILGTKISNEWPETLVNELKSKSVFNELLAPEDVANVALFLLSDRSKGVTGTIVEVNNGFRH